MTASMTAATATPRTAEESWAISSAGFTASGDRDPSPSSNPDTGPTMPSSSSETDPTTTATTSSDGPAAAAKAGEPGRDDDAGFKWPSPFNPMAGADVLKLDQQQAARLGQMLASKYEMVDRFGRKAFTLSASTLMAAIRMALCRAGVAVESITLEGSAAANVLNPITAPVYNDLDIVFHIDSEAVLDSVRDVVGPVFASLLTPPFDALSGRAAFELMVGKQFIMDDPDGDAWAVYAIEGAHGAPGMDWKFVKRLGRPFEFSVDSFQILLDGPGPAAAVAAAKKQMVELESAPGPVSPPLIVARSSAMSVSVAVEHLNRKHIVVKTESDMALVRGGGLLKYARFLSRGWITALETDRQKLQRYMVNRFLVDFPIEAVVPPLGLSAPMQAVMAWLETHLRSTADVQRQAVVLALREIIVESNIAAAARLLEVLGLSPSPPAGRDPSRQQQNKRHRRRYNHRAPARSKSVPPRGDGTGARRQGSPPNSCPGSPKSSSYRRSGRGTRSKRSSSPKSGRARGAERHDPTPPLDQFHQQHSAPDPLTSVMMPLLPPPPPPPPPPLSISRSFVKASPPPLFASIKLHLRPTEVPIAPRSLAAVVAGRC